MCRAPIPSGCSGPVSSVHRLLGNSRRRLDLSASACNDAAAANAFAAVNAHVTRPLHDASRRRATPRTLTPLDHPLSSAQRHIWLAQQRSRSDTIYNVGEYVVIDGA